MQAKTIASQAAQAAPAPIASKVESQAVPTNRAELDALLLKRNELQNQLESLTRRRQSLATQRQRVSASSGGELDARMALIDQRSAQIEQEIFQADEAVATAMGRGIALDASARSQITSSTSQPLTESAMRSLIRNQVSDAVMESMLMTGLVVFGAAVVWKGIRRLFRKKKPAPAAIPDPTARLEQLQQSMDVIAIEVERISEGQRFMARTLNDRGIGPGEAQHLPAKERAAIPLRDDRR